MSTFVEFQAAVFNNIQLMSQETLFLTATDKDEAYALYLSSFPEGTNPLLRKRTEHDCSCCRGFIKQMHNVVSISGDTSSIIKTIWDINIGGHYQVVADAMAKYTRSKAVNSVFLSPETNIGAKLTVEEVGNGNILWDHFYCTLPLHHVVKRVDLASSLAKLNTNESVMRASLEQLPLDALELVLDLINSNSILRGKEHKASVKSFIKLKREYDVAEDKLLFVWDASVYHKRLCHFKNSVIATLVADIASGKDLNQAIASYTYKVDPTNYNIPKALNLSTAMVAKFKDALVATGYGDSIYRRYATANDISVDNVLFINNDSNGLDMFDNMVNVQPSYSNIQEVSLDTFVKDIVPTIKTMKIMFDSTHTSNLMSIIAPQHNNAPNMMKWGNPFSWSYKGDVADSMMKERVKSAGGSVDGVLRFSLQWNTEGTNNIDFDAHCKEPFGNHIYHPNARYTHASSGVLDVDVISPGRRVAVENITWSDKRAMPAGDYKLSVHNFCYLTSNHGFTAEVEYNGKITSIVYPAKLKGEEYIPVATVTLHDNGDFSIKSDIKAESIQSTTWGISTGKFHDVSMLMNSPNHWDGECIGNKHYMFILEGCMNPETSRGFFNEQLDSSMRPYRKQLEVLGSTLRVEASDDQLSGLGFSDTKPTSFIVKVSGSFNRTLKVIV